MKIPQSIVDLETINMGMQAMIADEGSCTVEHLQHLAGVKQPEKGMYLRRRESQWAMLELSLWAAMGYKLERFCNPDWDIRTIERYTNLPKTKFQYLRPGWWRIPNPMFVVGVYLPAEHKEVDWPTQESETVSLDDMARRAGAILGAPIENGSVAAEPEEIEIPSDAPEWDTASDGPNPYLDFAPRTGQARSAELVRWKINRKRVEV